VHHSKKGWFGKMLMNGKNRKEWKKIGIVSVGAGKAL
jgi:hypothetical protein